MALTNPPTLHGVEGRCPRVGVNPAAFCRSSASPGSQYFIRPDPLRRDKVCSVVDNTSRCGRVVNVAVYGFVVFTQVGLDAEGSPTFIQTTYKFDGKPYREYT
jgi:hypothetical protein